MIYSTFKFGEFIFSQSDRQTDTQISDCKSSLPSAEIEIFAKDGNAAKICWVWQNRLGQANCNANLWRHLTFIVKDLPEHVEPVLIDQLLHLLYIILQPTVEDIILNMIDHHLHLLDHVLASSCISPRQCGATLVGLLFLGECEPSKLTGVGRRLTFLKWKTTSIPLEMEDDLNFFRNGRRPQILFKWKAKLKTTSISK